MTARKDPLTNSRNPSQKKARELPNMMEGRGEWRRIVWEKLFGKIHAGKTSKWRLLKPSVGEKVDPRAFPML